jgi:hypothetical protein
MTMTTKPKTRKAPAPGVNPRLVALAAKVDEAEAEFNRALDVLRAAEQNAWHNREDKAAQASLKKAQSAEGATCDASARAAEKFSKARATNLDELCLKARCAARYMDVWDEIVASIISDLLALGRKPKASAPKEANKEGQHARHS